MDSSELLGLYESLAHQSQQMLEVARLGDWDRLIELEHSHAAASQALMELERECRWSQADQSRKGALIRRILETDEETQRLVGPRRHELQAMITYLASAKKLQNAYAAT